MDAILNPIEPALGSAVAKALATLTAILDDAAAPAAHKIRAACTILRISMSWPKQRDAAASASSRCEAPDAPTQPATHHTTSTLPADFGPPTPSLAARLNSLSLPLPASPAHPSRTATLLAAAGATPLARNFAASPADSVSAARLARTG